MKNAIEGIGYTALFIVSWPFVMLFLLGLVLLAFLVMAVTTSYVMAAALFAWMQLDNKISPIALFHAMWESDDEE